MILWHSFIFFLLCLVGEIRTETNEGNNVPEDQTKAAETGKEEPTMKEEPVKAETETKKKRPKILVLYERRDFETSYVRFLTDLKNKDRHEVIIKSAATKDLVLRKHEKNLYSLVIVMAPSTEHFGGNVTTKSFVEYTENGGSLMVTADTTIGSAIRELAAEYGVEYDEAGTSVISHKWVDELMDQGDRTRLMIRGPPHFLGGSDALVGDSKHAYIPWTGIGMKITHEQQNTFPVFYCSDDCYSWFPGEDIKSKPLVTGRDVTLITGIQLENNARLIFSGSSEVYSDNYLMRDYIGVSENVFAIMEDGEKGEIYKYIENVSSLYKLIYFNTKWLTQQQGRYKIKGVRMFPVDDYYSKVNKLYVNQTVRFEIDVEEYIENHWIKLNSDGPSFTVELNLMETVFRGQMKNTGRGLQHIDIRLPDKIGIYDVNFFYKRVGWNNHKITKKLTIHPISYDMYERFLPCAYPYYASAFSMMFGVFLLSFTFLYQKQSDGQKMDSKKKK